MLTKQMKKEFDYEKIKREVFEHILSVHNLYIC
jgi:hypothetical protein